MLGEEMIEALETIEDQLQRRFEKTDLLHPRQRRGSLPQQVSRLGQSGCQAPQHQPCDHRQSANAPAPAITFSPLAPGLPKALQ